MLQDKELSWVIRQPDASSPTPTTFSLGSFNFKVCVSFEFKIDYYLTVILT